MIFIIFCIGLKEMLALNVENDTQNFVRENNGGESPAVSISSSLDEDEVAEKRYEKALKDKYTTTSLVTSETVSTSEFEAMIRSFNPMRLGPRENVIKWWYERRDAYKELFSVAEVIFSVPSTEVSVERLFSQLRFILDPLRTSLSDEHVNEILVLKTNMISFAAIQ